MKTIKAIQFLCAGVAMVFLTGQTSAQEVVTEPGMPSGARGLGMGGAQIAAVNDVTAVIANPAALARIDKLTFNIGLASRSKELNTTLRSALANGSGSATDDTAGLGTVGIAYPVPTDQGSLVFAVAYNRATDYSGLFSLSSYNQRAFETETDVWEGYEDNEISETGRLGVVTLAGAVDVSPTVSVGAALDIWTGDYSVDNRLLRTDTPGGVSWMDATGGEDEITAWSLKPAILYANGLTRFGAFIRFPMTFHIDQKNYEEYYSRNDGGFFTIHEPVDPYTYSDYLDSSDSYRVTYKVKTPMQFGMGFSYGQPGRKSLAFDVVYENWTQGEFGDNYDPYYFRDKYRSTMGWNLGVEHPLPFFGLVGRAGYMHVPLRFKGPRVSAAGEPVIKVKTDRTYLTFGVSKSFDKNLQLDAAYAQGYWETVEGGRTDKETQGRLMVTLSYVTPMIR